MSYILIHGLGHKETSWKGTISHMEINEKIFYPSLASILNKKKQLIQTYMPPL